MSFFSSRYELPQFYHVSFQFLHLLVMLRTGNETVKINLFICIENIFEFFLLTISELTSTFLQNGHTAVASGFQLMAKALLRC